MIKTDFYKTREDGVNLYRTYSDLNVYIYKTTEPTFYYNEAIDIENCGFTYEESDQPIEGYEDPNTATIEDYQNGLRDLGVNI